MLKFKKGGPRAGSTAFSLAAWTIGCLIALGICGSSSAVFSSDAWNTGIAAAPAVAPTETPAPPPAMAVNPIVPMMTMPDPAPLAAAAAAWTVRSVGCLVRQLYQPDFQSGLLRRSADVDRSKADLLE